MINHDLKCIFVEVPKTGSSSIRSIVGCPEKAHRSIIEIKNQITEQQFDEYFKFGYVRNPWDRAVSLYNRICNKRKRIVEGRSKNTLNRDHEFIISQILRDVDYSPPMIINKYTNLTQDIPFNDFIKLHKYATDTCFHPTQKKYQLDFLTNSSGQVIVDFIGRFENLDQDFNIVCDKIGIPQQTLPHKNKSTHKHYTEYYDDKSRRIIMNRFDKDIEYFGYKFGD